VGEAKRKSQAQKDWEASGKRLGDGPVQEEFYEKMKALGQVLDQTFNGKAGGPDRKIGFVLMVFPFDAHNGRCNYLSNGADRSDIIALMKEMIARFEGQAEVRGNA
jgi:hypothetical protein